MTVDLHVIERRLAAAREAAAVRLVGAAVSIAATAKPVRRFGVIRRYEVTPDQMYRLIEAARTAGFVIPPLDKGGNLGGKEEQ